MPMVYTMPIVDTTPMVDPIPMVYPLLMVDHILMVDPIPMVGPIPMVDPIPMGSTIPIYHPHYVLSHCLRRRSIEQFPLVIGKDIYYGYKIRLSFCIKLSSCQSVTGVTRHE